MAAHRNFIRHRRNRISSFRLRYRFTHASMVPHMHFRDVLFMATIVFALGGSESASFLGDEVHDARKNLPRGLLAGGAFVTTGYILGTVAVLIALPANEVSGLQGIMQAITKSVERIGFSGAVAIGVVSFAALLITVSNLGAMGAWLAVSARLPFVAGLDRYLPPAFARIHPKWGTPYVALLVQAACGVVFIFLGQAGTSVYGAYEVLVGMGIISYFIPYLFVFASLIRLQRERPGPDVMRIPRRQPRRKNSRRPRFHHHADHHRLFRASGGRRSPQNSRRHKNHRPHRIAPSHGRLRFHLG